MLALDPAEERGAAWQSGGPAGGAGLSNVDKARLDAMAQALGQRLRTLLIDEPAVETTPVQVQSLECSQLARTVGLGGIGECGDHG